MVGEVEESVVVFGRRVFRILDVILGVISMSVVFGGLFDSLVSFAQAFPIAFDRDLRFGNGVCSSWSDCWASDEERTGSGLFAVLAELFFTRHEDCSV